MRYHPSPSPALLQQAHRQAGMTLMEIMIAVFLLALMGSMTAGVLYSTFRTKETVIQINDEYHSVRVVLDRMAREISMAFIASEITSIADKSKIPVTLFKGEEESPVNKLTFTSFAHIRIVRNARESDQNLLGYYGKSNPQRSRTYRLFRRVKPRLDSTPEEGGTGYALIDNVVRLELRYWDRQKTEWVREWDTTRIEQKNQLPPMVEIKLTILNSQNEEVTFLTRTLIEMTGVVTR